MTVAWTVIPDWLIIVNVFHSLTSYATTVGTKQAVAMAASKKYQKKRAPMLLDSPITNFVFALSRINTSSSWAGWNPLATGACNSESTCPVTPFRDQPQFGQTSA